MEHADTSSPSIDLVAQYNVLPDFDRHVQDADDKLKGKRKGSNRHRTSSAEPCEADDGSCCSFTGPFCVSAIHQIPLLYVVSPC